MASVEIDNLIKTYGDFVAVGDVSATVADGEFITLLGPSGCGKTTLLNLISGFVQADAGRILIGGQEVTKLPPEKRETAMCFQSYALFPHLSVRENVAFGLRQKRWGRTQMEQRVNEIAAQLGLTEHMTKLPNELSGGQQQRVALGRALAVRPRVVLFDEPLSNLDAKLRESVRLEIRKIQAEAKLTAIYVTHDQSEALAMSDRIFVLNAGQVVQVGTPYEIYNFPASRFVADFIGAANILEGELKQDLSGGLWLFDTQIGVLRVFSEIPPSSGRHYLCWRPEDAQLGQDIGVNKHNRIEAQVESIAYQGSFTDLFVRKGDVTQRLQTSIEGAKSGDFISFNLPVNKVRLLEPVE